MWWVLLLLFLLIVVPRILRSIRQDQERARQRSRETITLREPVQEQGTEARKKAEEQLSSARTTVEQARQEALERRRRRERGAEAPPPPSGETKSREAREQAPPAAPGEREEEAVTAASPYGEISGWEDPVSFPSLAQHHARKGKVRRRLAWNLTRKTGVRQGVIMKEVLGPPVAMGQHTGEELWLR